MRKIVIICELFNVMPPKKTVKNDAPVESSSVKEEKPKVAKVTKGKKGKEETPVETKVETVVEAKVEKPKVTKGKKAEAPTEVKAPEVKAPEVKAPKGKKAKAEQVVEPVVETKSEPKPTKGGKKIVPAKEESSDANEEEFNKWKQTWAALVEKITEHQKRTQELEEERDKLAKTMENFIQSKKGTIGENILETTTKLKKVITKIDVNDDDSDSDTSDDDSDDDDDDDSEEDATPSVPLKNVKTNKFTPKTASKKKVVTSDSDSDSE